MRIKPENLNTIKLETETGMIYVVRDMGDGGLYIERDNEEPFTTASIDPLRETVHFVSIRLILTKHPDF